MLSLLTGEGDQAVTLVPRDRLYRAARASGVTYEIIDPRRSESDSARVVVAEAPATEDATSLSLDGDAGAGSGDDYRIPLASTAGVAVGHTYLLTNAAGESEPVIVASIDPTDSVRALGPLHHAYASIDTLRGIEWTADVPAAALADLIDDLGQGPLLVVWRYTLDGERYVLPQQFFAGRYSQPAPITAAELAAHNPSLARKMDGSGNTWDQAIATAMLDFIGELEALRIDPKHTLIGNAAKLAVRERAYEHAASWLGDDDAVVRHGDRYRHQMNTIRLGQPPLGTIEVKPATNTVSEPGSSRRSRGFFRRS